jgi:hypothetical protein
MRPGVKGNQLMCWLTLNFKHKPKAGDARDVKVSFHSVVLEEDQLFEWDYIAAHDYTLVGQPDDWMSSEAGKYLPDAKTTGDAEPPVGQAMAVQFTMPSKKQVMLKAGDEDNLVATLWWGGKKQDSAKRGLFLAYQKK